jgi:multiple sugar transport system ATP-binding protein
MRLIFDRVGRRYLSLRGPVHALQEVSFEVGDGELFVILGPSGCGKSTLLHLAAGLEKPTAGEIRFGDRVAAAPARRIFLSPRERNVAMVLQSYALYPHLKAGDNIAFPLRIAGVPGPEIRTRVQATARRLGIEELLDRKPSELSGGQRQRVAIGRAIIRQPAIFLLDEPLSNLDAQLRGRTRLELKQLQRELGVTTLYVTHDQTEAMTLGDRVALFRAGRLEQAGTPADLYHRPSSAFVAAFIGTPPMNLLNAVLAADDGRPVVELAGRRIPLDADRLNGGRVRPGPVVFGVRPEHVQLSPAGEPAGWTGRVAAVEYLGRENLVYVQSDGVTLASLTSGAVAAGDAVQLVIDPAGIHLFPPG